MVLHNGPTRLPAAWLLDSRVTVRPPSFCRLPSPLLLCHEIRPPTSDLRPSPSVQKNQTVRFPPRPPVLSSHPCATRSQQFRAVRGGPSPVRRPRLRRTLQPPRRPRLPPPTRSIRPRPSRPQPKRPHPVRSLSVLTAALTAVLRIPSLQGKPRKTKPASVIGAPRLSPLLPCHFVPWKQPSPPSCMPAGRASPAQPHSCPPDPGLVGSACS